ncbi:hypothetical protein HKD37_06G017151 [Glycine soja]
MNKYLLERMLMCNKCSCGASGGFSRPGSEWGLCLGAAALDHNMTNWGYLTLLQCVTDDAYEEMSPCASRWLTTKTHMKGITGAPYRAHCDALTVTDVCWLPYSDHRGVRGFELISSFQVRPERVVRQFGYIQTIPLPSVSADYIEWFFQISHPFIIPTQAGDEPRHPPAPEHDDYIQPDIPEVPMAFDPPGHALDDYEGYEAITERLEHVLNLRMVTTDTELHDIMQDCLRIARGVPTQMEVLGLDKDGAQSIDDFTFCALYMTHLPGLRCILFYHIN